ncbi:hypothetical protein MLD38_029539 [Melastoma candidum]|uniref:Uncharacterized protein n=1 Tax=Melastoma candidum TaxID=119954 RepID=A0ACB9N5W1_9MYRT|nr:hypothetical protein MLD38_029539 [Melastoma candidum]
MHRSASYSRVSDEDYSFAPTMASHILRTASYHSGDHDHQLPTFDPILDVVRKDKPRARFAENAVHAIPLVLLLCAILLWFFSGAVTDVGLDKDSIAVRIEGMTIEGDFDTEVDGTSQTGLLPLLDAGDDDASKQLGGSNNPRRSKK